MSLFYKQMAVLPHQVTKTICQDTILFSSLSQKNTAFNESWCPQLLLSCLEMNGDEGRLRGSDFSVSPHGSFQMLLELTCVQ